MTKVVRYGGVVASCLISFLLLRMGKISFIFGSHTSFFSGVSIGGPLAMVCGGWLGGFVWLGLMKFATISGSWLVFAMRGVPNFIAGWYWRQSSRWLRVVFPLVIMGLFLVHPVGGGGWLYASLWLIPAVVGLLPEPSLFLRSLATTYIAHGIGAVVWLYSMPMSVASWNALMPVAFCERLLFATAMVLGFYVIAAIRFVGKKLYKCMTMMLPQRA